MPKFLFDTDHLTLCYHKHPPLMKQMGNHPPDAIGISVVTVEESMRGRLASVARHRSGSLHVRAYAELLETVLLLHRFPLIAYDQASENQFQQLLTLRLRVGTKDLKIAAAALVNQLTVLTCNDRDFGRVPGLVIEDWSV